MVAKKDTTNSYGADQIQVLEGLEPVRKRPGMYIGSTGQDGLHHLVTEIVNNSMDEAIAGFADHIKLVFHKNGAVTIYDNGRGVPYETKKGYNVSALELAFSKLHAGGKFGGGGYKVSSGLHGVGSSVVNALSKWMRVVTIRDKTMIQEYKDGGEKVREVEELDLKNPTKLKNVDWTIDMDTWNYDQGSVVSFRPDESVFETTDFKFSFFKDQIREYAYLTAGIKFEIEDRRVNEHYTFYFEGGIKAYLDALNRNKKALNEKIFYVNKYYEEEEVNVEVALQYNDSFAETVLCFANHLKNAEGGTHLTGFRSALTKTINDYARENNLLKESDPNLSGDDLKEGLTAIISVKLDSADLQFEGQTKGKLGNTNVRTAVEAVVKEALENYLNENPKNAQSIIQKNILAFKARMAAKAARDTVIRKTALDGSGVLPGKLSDCSEKGPEGTEVFIVEGDSAGGTAKASRNRQNQAILPVFGKILNTERTRLDRVVSSKKLKDLIIALGSGIGEQFDIENLRYGKVILMADADVDGMHIVTLYLTLFYRHLPELIEDGKVYVAVPPLFKASWGKNKKYLFDEEARQKFLKTPEGQKALIQRFKGLGEMNPDELWDTTMNPETRRLKKITINDAAKADETFSNLMGEDVAPRKKFIKTHAKSANLDLTN